MGDEPLQQTSSPLEADEPPSRAPPKLEAVAQRPAAEQVKAWGDAVTALLKAFLLMLAIVVVGIVAGTAVWRDQHSRGVAVEVDPQSEKTLRARGSDFDLRQALVDALNERVRGVQQIVAVNFAG